MNYYMRAVGDILDRVSRLIKALAVVSQLP
jgi:hypothetical protein